MFVFGEIFPGIEALFMSGDMGPITVSEFFEVSPGLVGFAIVIMAVGMFLGGEWLERKFNKETTQ